MTFITIYTVNCGYFYTYTSLLMGQLTGITKATPSEWHAFTTQLVKDLQALRHMYREGLLDSGHPRMGVEQEVYLVDKFWRPAPKAVELLQLVNRADIVPEYASFNAEINIPPALITENVFSDMHEELQHRMNLLDAAAHTLDTKTMLVGILPNLRTSDVTLHQMTPLPRYALITSALQDLRGGDFEFHIEGFDELILRSSTPLFEACNTSFQVHYQLHPGSFVSQYNWAQAITGPVLSIAVNSPLLLGKRLWKETRIALFQQAIDTRKREEHVNRDQLPRVHFGTHWVRKSLLEVLEDNVARFRPLIWKETPEDALDTLLDGRIPQLQAFSAFNGTVYRWNRICYGITEGKPHLRLENRVFPSGPTLADEMANAALWIGLMHGMPVAYEHIHQHMAFDDAKNNFRRAAIHGLETEFRWVNGKRISPRKLLEKELIPIAREGLQKAGVSSRDIDYYLGIISERTASRQTGAQWLLESFNRIKEKSSVSEAMVAVTAALYEKQVTGSPAHTWEPADLPESASWECRYGLVEQLMTRDLTTVRADDPLSLVINLMDWRRIRHVPVEDDHGHLAGLLTIQQLFHHYSSESASTLSAYKVADIMAHHPVTTGPETRTADAFRLMRQQGSDCVLVVNGQKLVGILTEFDFARLAGYLLDIST